MTEPQMRELVCSTFATTWPTASGGVPFALENEARPTSDTFVQLVITPTTSAQATHGRAGNRKVRRNGWIQVKMFGPIDQGSFGLAALGDVAQGILEMVSLPSPVAGDDPVTTLAANNGPAAEDGRWYVGLLRVPFRYTETK